MTQPAYDASSIRWLKDDIDKVQGNHNYYVGANGSMGVRQMPIEVAGNSMDEGANGHGDTIIIRVDADGTCTVWDFGRGIPVGEHPEHPGHNVLTILCTTLHSGGKKSDQSGYSEGTVGTHGLGMTVVNALSHSMTVWTNNVPRVTHMQQFERGKPITGVVRTRDYPAPPHVQARPGTVVQFRTDLQWFGRGAALDWSSLVDWIKEASWFSYCNIRRGDRVVERRPMRFICIGPDGKAGQIKRAGLDAYFDARLTELGAEPVVFTEAFHMHAPNMDVVLGWSSDDGDHVAGYVNAVRSALGGTHTEALLKVVDTVFRRYAKPSQRYKVADLLAGAVGCINIRIKEPHFDSQSKTRLTSPVAPLVVEQLQPVLEAWAKRNVAGVREIIDRACSLFQLTSQLKDDRRIAAALKVKTKGKILLPPKGLWSHTKNPAERELFLVEGDSAKGGCDTASERYFQEILPLRGKLPNMMRPEKRKRKNEPINPTIVDILKATGITPADGTSRMRVGKIMILTDADADGSHIAALLCGLFLHYAPTLFDEGKIWFVDTPLFAHQSKTGVKTYARSYAALAQLMGDRINAAGSTLTRAKGLGELNPDILEEVVFNRASRRLIQITSEVARGRVKRIMGEQGDERRLMAGASVAEDA